jgi:uncharacterized membrane protein (DUF2068 family)
MTNRGPQPAGVRVITAYKTIKAGTQLSVALLLVVLLPFGLPGELQALAVSLRRHATHAWASDLAALLQQSSTPHGIRLACLALGLDGSLTGLEAWALRAGHWWGPWLVVGATGLFLPFEVYALVTAPHASRALLLVANLGIVAYLARRASRGRQPGSVPERS